MNWWLIKLQKTCIFKYILNSLLFVFYNNLIFWLSNCNLWFYLFLLFFLLFIHYTWFLLFPFKGRRGLTHIALLDILAIGNNDYVFLFFHFYIWCLNRAVSALFTLPFVEFTNPIYLLDDLSVNFYSFFRIIEFFLQHWKIKHFILNFFIKKGLHLQSEETFSSQLGLALNCSSQASTIL